MPEIINLSGYKFVTLSETMLPPLRTTLLDCAKSLNLKGTILLATEGINAFLAGERAAIDSFLATLHSMAEFQDLRFKESITDYQPFNRMLVRIKREIIPMNNKTVTPEKKTAPHLSPSEFKKWYEEKRDMVVLDTRNDFEVALGTFENAVDMKIAHFREFSDAVDLLPHETRKKPIVTFCTGGIRCEKAAELMLQKGFEEVYQLDGGILNYFEKCGGDFYRGECFVFDQRVSVDSHLKETKTKQCYDCRSVVPGALVQCNHCGSEAVSEK